jgi:hypothetical protein
LLHFEKKKDMAYRTPRDLNLYPVAVKKEMKPIDAKYKVQVGY